MPSLKDIPVQAIRVPLLARSKMSVIDELLDILVENGQVLEKDLAFRDVVSREDQSSTGLERGIAVPHARTTGVRALCIAVGLAREGIGFDAMDGQYSRLFFLVLAPPEKSAEHIQILREIAFLVNDEPRRDRMLAADSPESLWSELNGYAAE